MPSWFRNDPSRISPTAHYTGYVWFKNGMSDPSLFTRPGQIMFHSLQPFFRLAARALGGLTLEQILLQRHRIIDHLLEDAIESGRVRQVVEVAAGLSPRGLRFSDRFAAKGLVYVEADLPEMADQKRARITGRAVAGHHVVAVNLLKDEGPLSLSGATASCLDPNAGTAVITEGLLNYFDRETVLDMWARIGGFLGKFPNGVYFSDLHLSADRPDILPTRIFEQGVRMFARGRTHIHFADSEDAANSLVASGFEGAQLHTPDAFSEVVDIPHIAGVTLVRVIDARL